jgi:hypothetical protein
MLRNEALGLLQSLRKTSAPAAPSVSMPSTSGYVAPAPSFVRTRDRQHNETVNREITPQVEEFDLYTDDCKRFSVEWANVYRQQREATTREQRVAAEKERVRLARIASELRNAEYAKQAAVAKRKQQDDVVKILLGNEDRRTINAMLRDQPANVIAEVVRRAAGSTLPFVVQAHLEDIQREGKANGTKA